MPSQSPGKKKKKKKNGVKFLMSREVENLGISRETTKMLPHVCGAFLNSSVLFVLAKTSSNKATELLSLSPMLKEYMVNFYFK